MTRPFRRRTLSDQSIHSVPSCAADVQNGLVSAHRSDIGTLRRVFNLAIEPRGYLAEGQNPFAKIKKRKMAQNSLRYVAVEEYHALTNEAKDLWWNSLISIAYGSGLRRNEILHLTWADVDSENQQIHVTPKKATAGTLEWEPKDHEKRVVPMSDETAQLLANLQAQAEEGLPYIFISPKRLERIRERHKIEEWTPRSEVINNLARDFGLKVTADLALVNQPSLVPLAKQQYPWTGRFLRVDYLSIDRHAATTCGLAFVDERL